MALDQTTSSVAVTVARVDNESGWPARIRSESLSPLPERFAHSSTASLCLIAHTPAKPVAFKSIETIEGAIVSVNLTPGGMPSIAVKAKDRIWTVRLGSIRYLIAHDFNPKAGQTVIVRGFVADRGELIAIKLECPQTRQKLTLRDDDGRPLWRGGAYSPRP